MAKNDNDEAAENILTRARERKKLTQAAVAEKCGVSQTTVSEWECGAATPRPKKWNTIAEVYGVAFQRLAEFFGEARAS